MNSKLVGCMFLSMLVGGACAGAAVTAGLGPIAGLAIYSATGSTALVSSAFLTTQERKPKRKAARAKPGAAVA